MNDFEKLTPLSNRFKPTRADQIWTWSKFLLLVTIHLGSMFMLIVTMLTISALLAMTVFSLSVKACVCVTMMFSTLEARQLFLGRVFRIMYGDVSEKER